MRIIARLNVGGPAFHCIALSRGLREKGFETLLVTGSPEKGEEDFESLFQVKTEGFRLVRLPTMKRSLSFLGDVLALGRLILLMAREKPQIVHTHTTKAGVLGRVAARVTGVPVVIHTFHGHVLSGYFSPTISRFVCMLERYLARGTTTIVTLSNGLRAELSGKFRVAPESQFSVVSLGRDITTFAESSRFKGELKRELHIDDSETRLIGCIGRLVPIKDHAVLLEAASRLPRTLSWRLLIIGGGELLPKLTQQCESLGISDRVHFLGWRSDLARIYADLDLCVLSSKNEGTPLSIIESFAAGVPVVATRVGGVPDMFSPDEAEGKLVPPGDPQALAEAIGSILTDPKRHSSAALAAREKAKEFSIEKLLEQMAVLYRRLLA